MVSLLWLKNQFSHYIPSSDSRNDSFLSLKMLYVVGQNRSNKVVKPWLAITRSNCKNIFIRVKDTLLKLTFWAFHNFFCNDKIRQKSNFSNPPSKTQHVSHVPNFVRENLDNKSWSSFFDWRIKSTAIGFT